MENLFLHYMHEKARREEEQVARDFGPVITISREYGCYGSQIGQLLADKINQVISPKSEREEWFLVSHQVLHDASETLEASPNEISHIFGAEEKTILGDLVSIFSKDKYISDTQIKRTIAQIVRSYSEQGHSIIVGRAGCVIAKHIKKSVHVRLMAPFCWRVNVIKKRFDISSSQAIEKVKETDKRRDTFMDFFRGNKPDSELFDMVFNRATMSTIEIVGHVFDIVKNRGLI